MGSIFHLFIAQTTLILILNLSSDRNDKDYNDGNDNDDSVDGSDDGELSPPK